MPALPQPDERAPFTTRTLLEAISQDDVGYQVKTEHFAYSTPFFAAYPATDMFLLSSGRPIDFSAMATYFTQIEAIDAAAAEAGLVLQEDSAPMWLYSNDGEQPIDHGDLVSSPFLFEIGYPIRSRAGFEDVPAPGGGVFLVRRLKPLSVASIIYRGSFPYQENSGFVAACQSLLPAIEQAGQACAGTLYREIYHLTDWEDPSRSVTEIQVELRGDP